MNIFQTANQYLAWNQHLAGWAQFVGGVLSIGAAIWLASEGQRASRRQDARRAYSVLGAALVATAEAATIAADFTRIMAKHTRASAAFPGADFDQMCSDGLASIDAIPKYLLDDPIAVEALMISKYNLQQVRVVMLPALIKAGRVANAFNAKSIEIMSGRVSVLRKQAREIRDLLPPRLRPAGYEFVDQDFDPLADPGTGTF